MEKELNKIGISEIENLNIEIKNYISKDIADKFSQNIKQYHNSYNEIYMRIYNCKMYYANIESKYNGVYYFEKDNSLYLDKNINLNNINKVYENLISKIIYYLQKINTVNKKKKHILELSRYKEFEILGLGINEAMIQYITSKILGNQLHRINLDKMSFYGNNEGDKKYLSSLVYQLIFLLGEEECIKSIIESNYDFENNFYKIYEDVANKILKNFDFIWNEYNKVNIDEEKIIKLYAQTQEFIYKTYFNNMLKRANEIKKLDEQVDKLENFEKLVGNIVNDFNQNNEFYRFKNDVEGKYLKRYVEINKNQNNNSLLVIYKNKLVSLWVRMLNFIESKLSKE